MSTPSWALSVPEAWREPLADLQHRIAEVDPDAHLTHASFDEYGVMRVRASASSKAGRQVKQLLREWESQMLTRCELCGGDGRVRGGVILTVRCDDCVEPIARSATS